MFFFPRGNKGMTRMTLGSGDFLLVGYMRLEKKSHDFLDLRG